MTELTIEILKKDSSPVVQQAQAFMIVSDVSRDQCVNIIKELKRRRKVAEEWCAEKIDKDVEDLRGVIKRRLNDKWQILDAYKHHDPKYKDQGAIPILEGKLGEYELAEQARQDEERAKIEAELRAVQQKELERIGKAMQKNIDKAGNIQDQIAVLEAMREAPDLSDVEVTAINSQIAVLTQALNKASDSIQAQEVKAQATAIEPVVAMQERKISGGSVKTELVPTVLNLMALVQAVAQGKAPVGIIKIDMVALKRFVNATAGSMLPAGVSVRAVPKVSVRG